MDAIINKLFAAASGSTMVTLRVNEERGVTAQALAEWTAAHPERVVFSPGVSPAKIARSGAHWQAEQRLRALLTATGAAERVSVILIPLPGDPVHTARQVVLRQLATVTVVMAGTPYPTARADAIRRLLVTELGAVEAAVAALPMVPLAQLRALPRLRRQRIIVDQAHLFGSLEHAALAVGLASVDYVGCSSAEAPPPAPGWTLGHIAAVLAGTRVSPALTVETLRALWLAGNEVPGSPGWTTSTLVPVMPAKGRLLVRSLENPWMRSPLPMCTLLEAASAAGSRSASGGYVLQDETARRMTLEEWHTLVGLQVWPLRLVRPAVGSPGDSVALFTHLLHTVWPALTKIYPRTVCS